MQRRILSSHRGSRSERLLSGGAATPVTVRNILRTVWIAALVAASMLLGSTCYAQSKSGRSSA
ncbi:hypothetical protein, partial [Serratia marcescens]|uniref:hypothetical protein n=1 Tax=Serratia marcescens TaxID=615 RepID=UPI0019531FD5